MTSKAPDLEITAYDKDRKSGAKIGVGWTQDDGSISLVLNPGTALIYQTNMTYRVKKKDAAATPVTAGTYKPERAGWKPPPRATASTRVSKDPDFDDDIPF